MSRIIYCIVLLYYRYVFIDLDYLLLNNYFILISIGMILY